MTDERIADLSAQIAAANDPKPAPPAENASAAEADPEPQGEGEQHEEAAASENVERKTGKKPGVHQRIDELTREKYEARREADELRAQLAALEAALEAAKAASTTEAKPQPEADPRPKLEDFDFNEQAHLDAVEKWATRKAERELDAKRTKEQHETRVKELQTQFAQRLAKFEESNPGAWDAAIKAPIKYTPAMLEVITLSERGPELGHYLSQHLDEADRISQLTPVAAAAALGRIEASLSAPRQPEKQASRAPAPPTTLGSPAPAKKEWGQMSTEEHIAAWRAKQANR
jgi:hypothetical protein